MLSPDAKGDFEIHISDMLNLGMTDNKYDIIQEVKNCESHQPVCIFGSEEAERDKILFKQAGAKIVIFSGSHHYNNNYSAVADSISQYVSK
jgi:type IV secretory pathway VirJ component